MLLKTQKKTQKIDKILILPNFVLMLPSSPDTPPPPPGGVWVEKCILCFNFFEEYKPYGANVLPYNYGKSYIDNVRNRK